MAARRHVGELAVAGQLVGLLAVFAPSLTVALPGQAAVSGQRSARTAGGQAEIDPGSDRVRALGLLLGTARGQHHRVLRGAEHLHRLPQLRNRHPGQPLHQLRPVSHRTCPGLVPAAGALPYELLVHPPLRHDQMQHPERERQIRAGPGRQVEVGLLGGPGPARIDDDQPAAVLPQFGQIAQRRMASFRRGSTRRGSRIPCARCPRGGTAVRGRGRRPAGARRPPTTCRTARCSRSERSTGRPGRTSRARKPSRW